MKKFVLCFLFCCLLGAFCNVYAYQIDGQLQGKKTGKVYLLAFAGDRWTPFDSAFVKNGVFSLKGKVGRPAVVRFQMDQKEYPLVFLILQDTAYTLMTSVTEKGWLALPEIKGGRFQTRWNEYQKELGSFYEQKRAAGFALNRLDKAQSTAANDSLHYYTAALQAAEAALSRLTMATIVANSDNAIGSYLLYAGRHNYKYGELLELYKRLKGPADAFGRAVGDKLAQWTKVQPGQKAPQFTLYDPAGKEQSLTDYAGKWVVLDFWASWCAPCRKENPALVQWHRELKDTSVVVLGISLDDKREPWIRAIEKDGLLWEQLSDLRGWVSGVAKAYSVAAIPQKFLLDPRGMIVLANTDLDAIKTWLLQKGGQNKIQP